MRLTSWIVCILIAPSPLAGQETTIQAEFRREAEQIKKDCSGLDPGKIGDCAIILATGHPLHVAFGSIAPQNGFGLGAALVGHRAPNENWRLNWSADAVAAFGGAWRAGAYMKFVNTKVKEITVVTDPDAGPASAGAIRPYPVYSAYVQAISLPKLLFYGLGPATTRDGRSYFGLRETIAGGDAILPIARGGQLNLSLVGEMHGRFVDVRNAGSDDRPSIEQLYTEATAPGLTAQPGFLQFGEGVRLMPSLAAGALSLNYLLQFQQFVAPADSTYSFRRWTVDLRHEIPLYRNSRWPPAFRDTNTPNDCATGPSLDKCPSVSRNRTGTVGLRAFVSRSGAGSGSVVPFYFQQTLGGSDINGSPVLASYDDYRFRGPRVFLLQESLEHSLGTWPVGLWLAAEQGKVSLDNARRARAPHEDSGDVRYSVAAGLTLRAGGFPAVVLSFATGGSEGGHVAFAISTSLLGGSTRPSLY